MFGEPDLPRKALHAEMELYTLNPNVYHLEERGPEGIGAPETSVTMLNFTFGIFFQ